MKNFIDKLLKNKIDFQDNLGYASIRLNSRINQLQTKDAFSEK